MKAIEGVTAVPQNVIEVACPASPQGDLHMCLYAVSAGRWKCNTCGLAGDSEGYAHLNSLEAERHHLAIELEIREFEFEIAARRHDERQANELP
jgi:hypothetical protein